MNQPAAPGNGELLHVTRVESNYKATPDEGPGGWSYDLTRHVFLAGATADAVSKVGAAHVESVLVASDSGCLAGGGCDVSSGCLAGGS